MRIVIFSLLFIGHLALTAQGKLTFEKMEHDFGQIKEVDGPVEYSFEFTNTGNAAIKITQVKASCGCTTPFWTREEVAPGAKGKITAKYNVANRPGLFNKALTVSTNASSNPVVLRIKGNVEPKPKTISDVLRTKIGGMRVMFRSFNMGRITTEKAVTREFQVYNDSDSAWAFITEDFQAPKHVAFEFVPVELKPREKGIVRVTYDPVMKNDLGYQQDRVVLKTTDPLGTEKVLYVVATVEEYFPPMTPEELAQAPRLTVNKKLHDFGSVKGGSELTVDFFITNSGKSPLNIRDTKANCGCTVAALEKDTLEPGERVSMKVIFNTKGRKGRQFKNVTIFSNDPKAPTQMVTIKANILPQPGQ